MKHIWPPLQARLPALFAGNIGIFSGLVPVSGFAQSNTGETPATPTEMIDANMVMDSAPLIIGLGALAFAVLAMIWVFKARKNSAMTQITGQNQVAAMRARLDEYEAVLSCMPEVTILWEQAGAPQMFGQSQILGHGGMDVVGLLNYERWLAPVEAAKLSTGVKDLHNRGQNFSISVQTLTGSIIRVVGESTGDTSVVRLRKAAPQPPKTEIPLELNNPSLALQATPTSMQGAKAAMSMLHNPAWIRDENSALIFANQPYLELCANLGLTYDAGEIPELLTKTQREQEKSNLNGQERSITLGKNLTGTTDIYHLSTSSFGSGSMGYLSPETQSDPSILQDETTSLAHINQLLDAMTSPMVVFDAQGRLKRFNPAYRTLFQFDQDFLSPGLNEREIIDHLRRQGQLPAESDYRAWRTEHFKSYSLKEPRHEIWYLSDGRTLKIIATPDSDAGGVIYVFEDITEQLELQSANKAMLLVQRETLNALSEGVAVFGTDGRLRLHNSQLSSIWKLPLNQMGLNPHIDQIAQACGKVIPQDGEEIWQRLKRSVVDLDPGRVDQNGRIKREDGNLIDYAIVRLADSQTMLTFVDVTKSANYEHVLKERNDALVTADRLKDAFVQNVSYELRSPLTSIIGFADLLASDGVGPLNAQQRAYTDYIRASSATLGTLIDSILDLTNVDAGIAQLDLAELDIPELIKKAQTGFSATQITNDSSQPLNLAVSLPDPLPRFIADGGRIVQILYNLLSNAAKFSEPGAQINLLVEARGDWIRFIIEDQGVGVSQELKDALASSDQGQSLKGLQRGAGIGLTIVKSFVELHGGTLLMQSNTPRGSRMIVNLPADASKLIDQIAQQ